jgi:hypothetical protein
LGRIELLALSAEQTPDEQIDLFLKQLLTGKSQKNMCYACRATRNERNKNNPKQ